jgi:hypothetical protein
MRILFILVTVLFSSLSFAGVCALNGKACVGEKAISLDKQLVEITGVFSNDEVSIKYISGHQTSSLARQLGITKGCNYDYCVGDEVIFIGDCYECGAYAVKVVGIYLGSSNEVAVTKDGGRTYSFELNKFLALAKPNCLGEFSQRSVCN